MIDRSDVADVVAFAAAADIARRLRRGYVAAAIKAGFVTLLGFAVLCVIVIQTVLALAGS